MDLKNNAIKMEELFSSPRAKALLLREFPEFASPLMLKISANMTLEAVLRLAEGRFPKQRLDMIVSELESL